MHCIRCKQEMKKNNLRGVLVDYCGVCDAVWLDAGELEALQKGMHKPDDEVKKEHREEVLAERQRGLELMSHCPKCQEGSIKEKVMDGVIIDFCTKCRGLYFDHGELKQILENRKLGFFDRLKTSIFGM